MVKLLLALLLSSGAAAADLAAGGNEAQFKRLLAAYQDAFNHDDITRLLPYLDKDFHGTMVTGDVIDSPADLRLFWEKVKRIIRQGKPDGSYNIQLHPEGFQIEGDRASSRGRTTEVVRMGDGTVLKYQSVWSVDLRKIDGTWKVLGMKSTANSFDRATIAARLIANRVWGSWMRIKLPGDPDYDGDGGQRQREVVSF